MAEDIGPAANKEAVDNVDTGLTDKYLADSCLDIGLIVDSCSVAEKLG